MGRTEPTGSEFLNAWSGNANAYFGAVPPYSRPIMIASAA
jgi:hypothetical protein